MNMQASGFRINAFVVGSGWLAAGAAVLLAEGALVTANQPTALATVQQLDPVYVDVTALAAAAGSLTGALILNSRAILLALGDRVWRRSGN